MMLQPLMRMKTSPLSHYFDFLIPLKPKPVIGTLQVHLPGAEFLPQFIYGLGMVSMKKCRNVPPTLPSVEIVGLIYFVCVCVCCCYPLICCFNQAFFSAAFILYLFYFFGCLQPIKVRKM